MQDKTFSLDQQISKIDALIIASLIQEWKESSAISKNERLDLQLDMLYSIKAALLGTQNLSINLANLGSNQLYDRLSKDILSGPILWETVVDEIASIADEIAVHKPVPKRNPALQENTT